MGLCAALSLAAFLLLSDVECAYWWRDAGEWRLPPTYRDGLVVFQVTEGEIWAPRA